MPARENTDEPQRVAHVPTVLAVDDEEANRVLVEAILAPMGVRVVLACSGEEVIEKARHERPDVILMDVMMPSMDGLEAVRRLKSDAETAFIPVVMVTALGEVNDRVAALEAGADDFLTKPVERAELQARVKTLLQVKAYHDHMRDHERELEEQVAARTKDLRLAAEKIRAASLETIFRLAAAAECKDEDTGAHIARMAEYAAALAARMGLDGAMVENFRAAAPMHDIGKIGVPDRILLKPGKPDADEWEIIKTHTTIGGHILQGSDAEVIRLAETIAMTHHEKWDGSGYPRGLKGAEIPLEGRIAAVADVFDALSSRRPYRPEPMSPVQRIFDVIRDGRGTHFDPEVADAFLSIQPEILAIKEQFHDKDASRLTPASS